MYKQYSLVRDYLLVIYIQFRKSIHWIRGPTPGTRPISCYCCWGKFCLYSAGKMYNYMVPIQMSGRLLGQDWWGRSCFYLAWAWDRVWCLVLHFGFGSCRVLPEMMGKSGNQLAACQSVYWYFLFPVWLAGWRFSHHLQQNSAWPTLKRNTNDVNLQIRVVYVGKTL